MAVKSARESERTMCARAGKVAISHAGAARVALIIAMSAVCSGVINAQTKLYLFGGRLPGQIATRLVELDPRTGARREIPLPDGEITGTTRPVTTADGRFVAFVYRGGGIAVYDALTNQVHRLWGIPEESRKAIRSDARRTRLVIGGWSDSVSIIDAAGQRNVRTPGRLTQTAFTLSADGRLLYYARADDVAVVDVETGAIVQTIVPDSPMRGTYEIEVSSDGQWIYLRQIVSAGNNPCCRVSLHASTGALHATWYGGSGGASIEFDHQNQQLFVSTTVSFLPPSEKMVYALDPVSLRPRAQWSPVLSFLQAPIADPLAPVLYAMTGRGVVDSLGNSSCREAVVTLLEPATLRELSRFTALEARPSDRSVCAWLAVASAPSAPRELNATVAGNTVTLRWSAPRSGEALEHLLEAGSAPGLSDIAVVRLGPAMSLSPSGVPPGTYYVRVRAINVVGAGPASHELRIVVP